MKNVLLLAAVGIVALQTAAAGTQRVSIRVTPAVAFAPALLTIRTTIEPDDENRLLRIQVDSAAFSTSSEVQLNGRQAQRLSVLEIKSVPSGVYEIRAEVMGSRGPLGQMLQVVRVAPSAGHN